MGRNIIRKKTNNDDVFSIFCVFATVLLYGYLRSYITSRIGMQGSAYLYSSYDFIMIFFLAVPFAMQSTISRLVRNKLKGGQNANARRVLYGGIVVAIMYSIFSVIFLLAFKKQICNAFLLRNASLNAFSYLVPLLVASSFSAVFKGFLNGIKREGLYIISELVEKIAMILGVVIFCDIFTEHGNKVAAVVYNHEYVYAFGAAGAALGITFGYIIGLVISFVFYTLNKSILFERSQVRKSDDIYDVFSWIASELFANSGAILLIFVMIIANQTIFVHSMTSKIDMTVMSYRWGAYMGVLYNACIITVLWMFKYSFDKKKSLTIGMKGNNISEVRIMIQELFTKALKIAIPSAFFICIMSSKFVPGMALIESEYANKVVSIGAFIIIPMSLVVVSINILNAITRPSIALANSFFAFLIGTVISFVFVKILHLGLWGILISFLIYATINFLLNYNSLLRAIKLKRGTFRSLIPILIISAAGSVLLLLLSWIFGLFMPALMNTIVCFVIFVLYEFVAYAKFDIVNTYTLSQSPLRGLFLMIGRIFRVL